MSKFNLGYAIGILGGTVLASCNATLPVYIVFGLLVWVVGVYVEAK